MLVCRLHMLLLLFLVIMPLLGCLDELQCILFRHHIDPARGNYMITPRVWSQRTIDMKEATTLMTEDSIPLGSSCCNTGLDASDLEMRWLCETP